LLSTKSEQNNLR